ncbi:MAG: hypothetical protein Q8K72_14880 [Acidimicrobiales bacterium]|nr:hypothetical protein [Acidimicrobiales bacterium]
MAPLTWSQLAMIEPRLADLESDVGARLAVMAGEPQFCRIDEFYDRVKPPLFKLVGWHREESSERLTSPQSMTDEVVLTSSAAYDTAYGHLLELLPPCRGGGCFCSGARAEQRPPERRRARWSATEDPQVEQVLDALIGSRGLRSDGHGRQAIANNWDELDRRFELTRQWWGLAEAELLAVEDPDARRALLARGDFAASRLQETVAAMRETITRAAAADAVASGPPELRELCLRSGREDLFWFVEEFDAAAADASPTGDPDAFRSALEKRLAVPPPQ